MENYKSRIEIGRLFDAEDECHFQLYIDGELVNDIDDLIILIESEKQKSFEEGRKVKELEINQLKKKERIDTAMGKPGGAFTTDTYNCPDCGCEIDIRNIVKNTLQEILNQSIEVQPSKDIEILFGVRYFQFALTKELISELEKEEK